MPQKSSKNSKVRYAVVGLGWIAQESVLPGFKNATKNSELVALVTDDPEKARKLGKEYDVAKTVSYDGYDELLRSGSIDAVYIALAEQPSCRLHDPGRACGRPRFVRETDGGARLRSARA